MSTRKKILILSANPKDTARLRLDEEVREIEEGLRLSKYRDQFDICSRWAVRLRDIRRALLDVEPHIVHFTGHGKKDGLLVEDKWGLAVRISEEALSGLFQLFSEHVECVILSACYSAQQATAINKHIRYVIGMQIEIKDKAAIEFSVGFYDALAAGRSIDDSFEFGRNAVLTAFPDQSEHLLLSITRNVEKILNYLPVTLDHPEWKNRGRDKLDFIKKYATEDHRLIIKTSERRGIGIKMEDHPVFKIGDKVIIEYRSDRKGFTVLFEQDPAGNVCCLLPSVYMPSTSVQRALNLLSPEPINISEPLGTYRLYAVFSTEPFHLPWPSYYAEYPLPKLSQQEMTDFSNLLSSRPRESWRITTIKYTIKYY